MVRKTALTVFGGKGREINDYLRRELGIPDGAQWFEVRVAIDEPISVKCEYTPLVETADGKR